MLSRFGTRRALIQIALKNLSINYISAVQTSSKSAPEAVFLEKCVEEPILVLAEDDDVDLVGPPDPVSNLRPIIRKQLVNETKLQQRLRQLQDDTQMWNQNFWSVHNTNFIKERQEYIKNAQILRGESRTLTADEMSQFYKSFLDKNWETHVKYNFEWYQKNFKLLILSLLVNLQKNTRFS